MNLSQRLDQARARRNPAAEPTAYELRMTRDAQVYEGQHLRTGETMTPEQWEQLAEHESGLPAWNPNRANEQVEHALPDLLLDLTQPGADVIDLRSRGHRPVPSADGPPTDVFDMPAWAPKEQVFRGERE